MAGRKISYHKKGIEIWMPPSPFGSKLFSLPIKYLFIYLLLLALKLMDQVTRIADRLDYKSTNSKTQLLSN